MVAALAGCLATPVLARDVTNYIYDEPGRLTPMTYGDGVAVVDEYDAAGNRTRS